MILLSLIAMISQNYSCQLSKLQLRAIVIKIQKRTQEFVHDTFEPNCNDIPKLQLPATVPIAGSYRSVAQTRQQRKLNLLNACILYIIIVFIIKYIAISLSIYKNILLRDKFNFIDQFICSRCHISSIFQFYLFAKKILEYNFSQLNCYRIDKFPFHY